MEKQKKALTRLRINTVRDILYHFPTRYSNMSAVSSIIQAQEEELVTIYGVISNLRVKKSFTTKVPMTEAQLTDLENNTIKVVWFNQAFIAKTFTEGGMVKLTGKVSSNKQGKILTNPEFEKLKTFPIDTGDSLFNNSNNSKDFGFPIYRESRGVTSKWIYHSIVKILGSGLLENIDDPIPVHIREQYKLPSLQTALVWFFCGVQQLRFGAQRRGRLVTAGQ